MTNSKKELTVACNYLLRLMKSHVQLTSEQINLFKRVFHDTVSKRFVDHWFPATPHRGSAYRCLQTKHWKDPVLKTIAERSRLPLHRYLPAIFTVWIDPGEVAVCFGDDGTWCPLYKHDTNGHIHQEYSDGEETVSSLSSDDDVLSLTQNVKTLNVAEIHVPSKQPIESNTSRTSSPFFNPSIQTSATHDYNYSDWSFLNEQHNVFWPQQQLTTTSDSLSRHQRENH